MEPAPEGSEMTDGFTPDLSGVAPMAERIAIHEIPIAKGYFVQDFIWHIFMDASPALATDASLPAFVVAIRISDA